jgi:hypothetical protein
MKAGSAGVGSQIDGKHAWDWSIPKKYLRFLYIEMVAQY